MSEKRLRFFEIGEDTEIYIAYSEEEMRAWFKKQVGESADEQLAEHFVEITGDALEEKILYSDEGSSRQVTLRELAVEYKVIPNQISTSYH